MTPRLICSLTAFGAVVFGSQVHITEEVGHTLEAPVVERCYQELGCFNLDYPWVSPERPFRRLPDSPSDIGTTFYLSTRRLQGQQRQRLTVHPLIVLNRTDWDPEKWTFILTHGFRGNAVDLSWIRELESVLLTIPSGKDEAPSVLQWGLGQHQRDAQVVSVDWGRGAGGLDYTRAAVNTRIVGAETARLIRHLSDQKMASLSKTHLIGKSLGAHALSYVSAYVKGVARLTALDPAQPGFEGAHPDTRLDPGDAGFVDVIHTNAAYLVPSLGFGMVHPVGHVDFFVNGGKKQPGCWLMDDIPEEESGTAKDKGFIIDSVEGMVGCSHHRAYVYYIEALKSNCSFWGRKYSNWDQNQEQAPDTEVCTPRTCQQLGRYTAAFPARGSFYVTTNTEPPYCRRDLYSEFTMALYRLTRAPRRVRDGPYAEL